MWCNNFLIPKVQRSSRCQEIIWTNAGILLIWPRGTNSTEIVIDIYKLSFNVFDDWEIQIPYHTKVLRAISLMLFSTPTCALLARRVVTNIFKDYFSCWCLSNLVLLAVGMESGPKLYAYLINITDLRLLDTIPYLLFPEWWFGPFVCRAAPYLQAFVNTQAVVTVGR